MSVYYIPPHKPPLRNLPLRPDQLQETESLSLIHESRRMTLAEKWMANKDIICVGTLLGAKAVNLWYTPCRFPAEPVTGSIDVTPWPCYYPVKQAPSPFRVSGHHLARPIPASGGRLG